MNPANYAPFVDAEGGEWIRFTGTRFKGVVWRPSELFMKENGDFGFQVEVFEQQGFPEVTEEEWNDFGSCCGSIISEIIAQETAELQEIAEAQTQPETEAAPVAPVFDASTHAFFEGENANQVSDALLPQDLQADLAQVSQFLGGVKPMGNE